MALAIKEAGSNDLIRLVADFVAATDQDVTEENTIQHLRTNTMVSSRRFWVV